MISSEESLPGAPQMPCHSIVRLWGEAITAYSSRQLDANVANAKGESIRKAKWEGAGDPAVGAKRDVTRVYMLGLGTFELAEPVLLAWWAV